MSNAEAALRVMIVAAGSIDDGDDDCAWYY